jgi:hypothetical protein
LSCWLATNTRDAASVRVPCKSAAHSILSTFFSPVRDGRDTFSSRPSMFSSFFTPWTQFWDAAKAGRNLSSPIQLAMKSEEPSSARGSCDEVMKLIVASLRLATVLLLVSCAAGGASLPSAPQPAHAGDKENAPPAVAAAPASAPTTAALPARTASLPPPVPTTVAVAAPACAANEELVTYPGCHVGGAPPSPYFPAPPQRFACVRKTVRVPCKPGELCNPSPPPPPPCPPYP